MKNKCYYIILLLMSTCFCSEIMGQKVPQLKLGILVMPQKALMPNEDEKNDERLEPIKIETVLFGLSGGLIYEKFDINFGLNYSYQGVGFKNPTAFSAPADLRYLKIPVMINFHPFKKQNIPITIGGGFQVSTLLRATIEMPRD